MKLYNVLNKKIEDFVPQDNKNVKMYACGITASGNAHVGHAYQAIVFDVIKKYLDYRGYNVKYVRNYTDVDDKIILKAREKGVNPKDFANDLMRKIDFELAALGIDKPTIQSKATECIDDIIAFIEKLIESGHAYSTENGDVFFKVESFHGYGKLSNRVVEDGLTGVRKSVEPGKLDDKDFALWKNAKDDEIFWESPWGPGRPGWHIECSAMSMKYLGEEIDIHGGGKDLIFPHHENEIAQSESLTGKQFAKYWIHNGLVKINGQKMSKSLNNSILLEDLLKEYNFEVIRLAMINNKYSSDINFVDGIFDLIESKLYDIYSLFNEIDDIKNNIKAEDNNDEFVKVEKDFINAMDNDFNTAVAIANLYGYVAEIKKLLNANNIQKAVNYKDSVVKIYKVLGLLQQNPKTFLEQIKSKREKEINIDDETKQYIEKMIEERKNAKAEKNYARADEIRNELASKGIELIDTKEGTTFKIKN